jgi:hypothetical protein
LQSNHSQFEFRSGEEILGHAANNIPESGVPPHRDIILRNSHCRSESGQLYDFPELHVVQNFHGQPTVGPAGLVHTSLDQLKCANSYVRSRPWIRYCRRIGRQMESQPEKRQYRFFPKSVHFQFAHQCQVIELSGCRQGHRSPNGIGAKPHVSVSKQQPFAAGRFERSLQGVRLAEPAFRQSFDAHHSQSRIGFRAVAQNLLGPIG